MGLSLETISIVLETHFKFGFVNGSSIEDNLKSCSMPIAIFSYDRPIVLEISIFIVFHSATSSRVF